MSWKSGPSGPRQSHRLAESFSPDGRILARENRPRGRFERFGTRRFCSNRHWGAVAVLLLVISLPNAPCRAQSAAGGTITGSVVDPDHRVIPGATVTIRNNDFTSERTFTTDATGNFVAISLPAGTYTVQASASGFKPKKANRILLSVGSSVRVKFQLDLASATQTVTVTGRASTLEGNTVSPATNKDEPESGNFFAGLTVTYLPNRDRDFTEFAELSAGVDSGVTTGLVVAGQRPSALQTEIDGASFNDPLQGGTRGGDDNAMFFPQTVVREFQVVHSGADADIGGTNAGLMNIVTKQGSNKLHGEGFYIGRPTALSSRDAFGHSIDNEQNEFGGSLGGPIRKNSSFFYAGFEQDFLHVPYWTEFQQQAPGIVIPDELAALQNQIVERNNPTAFFARTDFLLNGKNTLNLAFNFNRLNASGVGNQGSTRTEAVALHSDTLTGNSEWARGNLSTVLRNNFINQFLLGWSRDRRDLTANSLDPEIFINGFGQFGGDGLAPHNFTSSQLQTSDDVAFSHGSIIVHLGASFAYDPATELQEPYLNGRFDFNSLDDFLALSPRRFQQTFIAGNSRYYASLRELGLYATVKFTPAKHLAITPGLRWDGQWNPKPSTPNFAIAQTAHIPNDLNQWQPRLGVAWNPRATTVIRLSSGIYDAPTPATMFHRVFTDNGANVIYADSYFDPELLPLVTTGGLHSLSAPPTLAVPAALVIAIDPNFRNPRSFQFSGSIEQQLTPKTNLTAGFVHNSTWDLQRRLDRNLFPPVTDLDGLPIFGSRPDPDIGRLLVNESNAHSTYSGLLLTSNFQLSRRTQVTANYTLASARDDDSNLGPFTIDSAVNPFDPAAERAYSSLDIRHTFNLSAIVNLPLGFKINPALIARSGLPYTPIVGLDLQNDANDLNDRALLNSAMVPRNSERQPNFANLDIRFVKDITLCGEGHHLDLFLDVFNVTGAQNMNFGLNPISFFGPPADPIFTAGHPLFAPDTNHFGGARQVQFTARIVAF